MNYVVFDLEFAQPNEKNRQGKQYARLPFEIIQIGAVLLDSEYRFIDTLDLKVKPRSKIIIQIKKGYSTQ